MVLAPRDHKQAQSAQQKLATRVLEPLMARRRPKRVLVLKNACAGDLPLEPVAPVQVIRLSTDRSCAGTVVQCRIDALPFEEAAFDVVVLHHLVYDGSEEFLTDVLRVLAAGGDLVISGLNSSGLRNRFGNRNRQVPALKLDKVCNFLKTNSFQVEQCLLMGLGGLSRPAPRATWYGLGLPFADRAVLHAHHQSNIKGGSILRFKKIHSSGVSPPALDGVSRRAV